MWFVDLVLGEYELLVQYSDKHGFGLSANPSEFGNAPDERPASVEEAVRRTVELLATQGLTIPAKTLSDLRGSQTQMEVANSMSIKQPSYAKMENSELSSFKVATLAKAVDAMHGRLHLVVETDDGKFFTLKDRADEDHRSGTQLAQRRFTAAMSLVGLVALDYSRSAASLIERRAMAKVITGSFRRKKEFQE